MPEPSASSAEPPLLPVCLVVDVSASMDGAPITAMAKALPELRRAVRRDPAAAHATRLAVVTFSVAARIALPLSDLRTAVMPELWLETETNFAAALRTAGQALEDGLAGLGAGTRRHRPLVVFITDGEHNVDEDWRPAWRRLTGSDGLGAELVGYGMGRARRETVRELSTGRSFFTADKHPEAAVRAILRNVVGVLKRAVGSPEAPARALGAADSSCGPRR